MLSGEGGDRRVAVVERERHAEHEAHAVVAARGRLADGLAVAIARAVRAAPRGVLEVDQRDVLVLPDTVLRQLERHGRAFLRQQLDAVDVEAEVHHVDRRAAGADAAVRLRAREHVLAERAVELEGHVDHRVSVRRISGRLGGRSAALRAAGIGVFAVVGSAGASEREENERAQVCKLGHRDKLHGARGPRAARRCRNCACARAVRTPHIINNIGSPRVSNAPCDTVPHRGFVYAPNGCDTVSQRAKLPGTPAQLPAQPSKQYR
jgi:hypothetical protein